MEESLYRRRLSDLVRGRSVPSNETARRRPSAPPLPPGRVVETPFGAYYLVEEPLERVVEEEGGPPLAPAPRPWRLPDGKDGCSAAERPVFFDLETTGFTSSPLFLSATIDLDAGVARQRFARNYAEERAVVAAVIDEIAGAGTLVTFNGRSYDIPFLRNRAAYHHLPFPLPGDHVDLLHHCRRAWKGRFPDFRLQTLEKIFAAGDRVGDVPGEEIPGLYHSFVRRGFDPRMASVFRHNLRDVITLVRLFFLLAEKETRRR